MTEFVLKNQQDLLVVQNELMNVLLDIQINQKPYIVTIKPYKKRRSLDANAYFHVLVDKIAKALKESAEEVKIRLNLDYGTIAEDDKGLKVGFKALKEVPITQFFKYAKPIGEVIENGKVFVKYIIYKETHTLTTDEMARLIDGAVQEAQQLGIQTLTPMEIENLKKMYKGEK